MSYRHGHFSAGQDQGLPQKPDRQSTGLEHSLSKESVGRFGDGRAQ
jgi:hypothetical protein